MSRLHLLFSETLILSILFAVFSEAAQKNFPFEFSGDNYFFILPTECFDIVVNDMNFTHGPCVKRTLSKILGYAIMFGASLLKLPQISIILAAKDVTGMTFEGQYFELLAFTTGAVYNFLLGNPVSTYGENLLIIVQSIVVIILMWKFAKGDHAKSLSHCISITVLYVICIAVMLHSPEEFWQYFFWVGLGSTIVGRVPQIISNLYNGHTGRLSLITTGMMFAGSLARIFTTLQEVDDLLILFGFVSGGFLNLLLVLEIVVFWSNTNKVLSKEDKKKAE